MNPWRTCLYLLLVLGTCAPVCAQYGTRPPLQAATSAPITPNPPHRGDPLLSLPMDRPAPALLPHLDEGRSPWHSAGIGALIGLGVGSAVGLVAANNHGGGMGDPGPGYVFAVCAGGGTLLGGLIGLLAGSSSGSGGQPFPGH
jgi:hypothetical protein